ncbi:conserved Plasmodium protein, unknown function [Plasmodium ovale]|uniref:Uncharacterized protein n=2 Tax=Plasmodium ovale TaxID=36330 RepID=A0A1A8VZ63_PLAOA|nr:conserved Plasmodium protein, unknown function [Plasmodium ovale curtisi]SBS92323.1 conserved Plasmodium protein, unknown function [Plasmodium ovale curtisi]SCQ16371.1 conserved Plasmodium protein, unknown function [Plasmodium ovale]
MMSEKISSNLKGGDTKNGFKKHRNISLGQTGKGKKSIDRKSNQGNIQDTAKEIKEGDKKKNKSENVCDENVRCRVRKEEKNIPINIAAIDEDTNVRYKRLKRKLESLNYKDPLCVTCTPLVQAIFDDLIQAIQNFQKVSDKYENSQKKYKELLSEKKHKYTCGVETEERNNVIGDNLFLSGKHDCSMEGSNNMDSLPNDGQVKDCGTVKEYEKRVEELEKKVEEERELKELYMTENKKLKFSLEILQRDTKEEYTESTDAISDGNFSTYNRTKSFDDFEVDKKRKKEKKKYTKGGRGGSIINDHTLSLGKELSYYKNLCKELQMEVEKVKNESLCSADRERGSEEDIGTGPVTEWDNQYSSRCQNMHSNGENNIKEKNEEIIYLKKRLNAYEMEIRKLNELRLISNVKEERGRKENLPECESNESENRFRGENTWSKIELPCGDDVDGGDDVDAQTKKAESVVDMHELNRMLNARNDEIYHLKNRVLLLETELQVKNDVEKKYKERLQEDGRYDGEVEELNVKLEEAQKELREARRRGEKYEKQYNEEKSEVAILKEELKILEREMEEKKSEFIINKNTIKSLKLESDEFNNSISCSNETKKQLTDYIHNLLNKLSESNDKIDELRDVNIVQKQKMEIYKKEIKKLKEDVIDSSNQIDEFASLLDKKDEMIENCKLKLETINREYADMTIKCNEMLKENKELQIMNTSHSANSSLIIQQLQQEINILTVTNNHLKKIEEDYQIVLQEKTIIEDAAIKIQTELKKSVEKTKSLETYIQTLSVEITNLKTQRDDSLDALTKVAIDKTQYENELIQNKSIVHELKKKISVYENNVLYAQNNISEMNKINIKKEQEEILLKNEIKSLKENLNEKNVQLEMLKEKENKFQQNSVAYNIFHLEAQKKYNSYEKVIKTLEKEIEQLTINNKDNLVIIERLKGELDSQPRNRTCDLPQVLLQQGGIARSGSGGSRGSRHSQDNRARRIRDDNMEAKRSTERRITPSSINPNEEYEAIHSENANSREEDSIYDYSNDFNIFLNSSRKQSYGKKMLNADKGQQRRVHKSQPDHHVGRLTNEEDDTGHGKRHDMVGDSESSSSSRSLNIDFLSFSKKSRKSQEEGKRRNDQRIPSPKQYGICSLSSNNKGDCTRKEDIGRDKLKGFHDDSCLSENSSSYLGNHDISLFSISKIKNIFNLSSTNGGEKLSKYTELKSSNKNNTCDIMGSKWKGPKPVRKDSHDDILFDFKQDSYFEGGEKSPSSFRKVNHAKGGENGAGTSRKEGNPLQPHSLQPQPVDMERRHTPSHDDAETKKGYNFISQTSYEANSNTSSILLDSVSSDFAHNVSVDEYNNTGRKKEVNNGEAYPNYNAVEFNSVLCSSNESHGPKGGRSGGGGLGNRGMVGTGDSGSRVVAGGLHPNEDKQSYENGNHQNEDVSSERSDRKKEQVSNRTKIKQELYNKYMNVLKSIKSEEMDASVNSNNRTIDLTNDYTKTQDNSTSMLSSSKTLQKDSLFSNLSKFKFNEEMIEYNCDPLMIIKPIEESNRDPI